MSAELVVPAADAARELRALGWPGVMPMGRMKKNPPPTGWTGHSGRWPDNEQFELWVGADVFNNVAIRVQPGIIGIDVDQYGDKNGAETLGRLEAEYGPLPPTWRSTSRGADNPSGIRWFRVPDETELPGGLGDGIEVIQWWHRFAMVWPSIHPEGRRYEWFGPSGRLSGPPRPEDLPELPERWRAVRLDSAGPRPKRSRHDQMLVDVLRLLFRRDEPGLEDRRRQWMAEMVSVRGEAEAIREWNDAVDRGRRIVASKTRDDSALLLAYEIEARHADDLLWYETDRQWLVWNGTCWAPNLRKDAERMALHVVEQLNAEGRPIKYSGEPNRREAALQTLSEMTDMTVVADDVNRYPDLFNAANRTLDLSDGSIRDPDPDDRLTCRAKAKFDPDADMSEWQAFWHTFCADTSSDALDDESDEEAAERRLRESAEVEEWGQAILGEALVGRSRKQLLYLSGDTDTGKSQLANALTGTLGSDYSHSATAALFIKGGRPHTEDLAALINKRLIVVPELPDGNWRQEDIKTWTGGDLFPYRHLYGRVANARCQALFLPYGNHLPRLPDADPAFLRRLIVWVAYNHVPPSQQIRGLGEKLAGPGVLRWLWEGAMRTLERGGELPPLPARVARDTKAYRKEQDKAEAFIDECCVSDASAPRVARSDVYTTYKSWCRLRGEEPWSDIVFGRRIGARILQMPGVRAHTQSTGVGKRGYSGLRVIWTDQ